MFDIGMTELLVIGIVALIVVGPKDLPGMFRTLGRFTAKIKGMAREFQRAMDDAADDAGVKDVAKDLRDATSSKKMGLDRLNDAASKFEKWEPGKSAKSGSAAGSETAKLSEERAESSARILEATGRAASERKAREAQAAAPVKTAGTGADTPLSTTSSDKEQG
ncbi:Sec-independent protein translocase protein TatB [Profundibacterium mesophilum]|uniref:Sec-independent protein translocase protein TatB n=1 Tax=Profundibacterium mesophilum KAUST100406-0324 TaxID=1037889 RepID=A0A921NNN4_9RHOB|nr:Sec-independent protein translocase protein TatB [Profundibacterium mesophilum]KAF0675126.1 Sec-independent protein translocase protein TatB [Profundibacterium mesophilum KAUST100406-0324]